MREPRVAGHHWIPQPTGPDDLLVAYHGSGRRIRVHVAGFRDGIKQTIQRYHIPACKRCGCPRNRHHWQCPKGDLPLAALKGATP